MNYVENLINVVTPTQIIAILALILADLITGVAAALRTGTFDIAKIANFLKSSVLPYFLVYIALGIVAALVPPELLGVFAPILDPVLLNASWVAIMGVLIGSVWENIVEIGVPIPTLQDLLNKTPLSKNNGK